MIFEPKRLDSLLPQSPSIGDIGIPCAGGKLRTNSVVNRGIFEDFLSASTGKTAELRSGRLTY